MKRPIERSEDLGLSVFLGLLTLVLFIAVPLMAAIELASWTWLSVLFSLLFVAGGIAIAPGRWRNLAMIAGFLALTVEWWARIDERHAVDGIRLITFLAFISFVMWGLGRRVMGPGRVTSHRLRGAVALFLLLGLAWAMVYGLLCQFAPGSITLGEAHPDGRFAELIFFSYVTLSTLGYGDIVPVSPFAQSLATLEALTGQLYLAILVARLVSLEIVHSRRDQELS